MYLCANHCVGDWSYSYRCQDEIQLNFKWVSFISSYLKKIYKQDGPLI